jgi:C_GCAxxG_C_C family probable redox protein
VTTDRNRQMVERAQGLLARSANCAQSTYAALAEHLGFEPGNTLKALTPFPGIGLRGDTCGAVTGCVMAIGMVLGRDCLDDQAAMQISVKAARRFCRTFEAEFGDTACRAILSQALGTAFDFTRPEGMAAYAAAAGPEHCSRLVGLSVLMAVEAIRQVAPGR